MPKPKHIYLAGPDVFLPDANEILLLKKQICKKYGFVGISPLDNTLPYLDNISKIQNGYLIANHNETIIKTCNILVANITPFRGPNMDPGTAYEIGFARGLKKPTFAYTSNPLTLFERTKLFYGVTNNLDPNNILIEDFDSSENVMISNAVYSSNLFTVARGSFKGPTIAAIDAFEACISILSNRRFSY